LESSHSEFLSRLLIKIGMNKSIKMFSGNRRNERVDTIMYSIGLCRGQGIDGSVSIGSGASKILGEGQN